MPKAHEAQRTPDKAAIKKLLDRANALDSGRVKFDDICPIGLTNLYLFASYAYYELDDPLLADSTFDKLCRHLLYIYDDLALYGVWHLGTVIVKENLSAGSCIGVEYPQAVRDIVPEMLKLKHGR